ncbi:hypothetical protein DFH08DRAFT_799706 [Mycena albidolilacea]|uniref:Uncharacterized protein n=1 Tax=Mycena albidolilacea TaxID=1033008 RepID=A0AAD7F3B1_9AGAR|nr:hypothetical protein DFH08DRAFT_799706 [Mycena albidolilacea]
MFFKPLVLLSCMATLAGNAWAAPVASNVSLVCGDLGGRTPFPCTNSNLVGIEENLPFRLSTRTLAFRMCTARVALAVAESGAAECSEGTVWLTREWIVKAGGCVKVSTDVSSTGILPCKRPAGQLPGLNNLEPLWKIVENHKHLEPVVEYTLSRPAIQSPHRKQEGNRKAGRSRTSLVRREMPACRLSGRFEDDGEKQVPRGHGASALSTATLPIPLIPECGTTF